MLPVTGKSGRRLRRSIRITEIVENEFGDRQAIAEDMPRDHALSGASPSTGLAQPSCHPMAAAGLTVRLPRPSSKSWSASPRRSAAVAAHGAY